MVDRSVPRFGTAPTAFGLIVVVFWVLVALFVNAIVVRRFVPAWPEIGHSFDPSA